MCTDLKSPPIIDTLTISMPCNDAAHQQFRESSLRLAFIPSELVTMVKYYEKAVEMVQIARATSLHDEIQKANNTVRILFDDVDRLEKTKEIT